MKTFSQKTAEIKREWFIIDASTLPLGKLAVVIADKLMGKFSPLIKYIWGKQTRHMGPL